MDATEPLRTKESGETLYSLQQLDPAPIDTDDLPDDVENIRDSKAEGSREREHTPRSPATTILFLSRIQRYSSYTLGIFTSIHLANTSLIPLLTRSVPASETYLLQARELYQTPLSEPLLVALPAAAHVASGLALRLLRYLSTRRRYASDAVLAPTVGPTHSTPHTPPRRGTSHWPHVSYISASGYAFSFFFAAHAFMNRLLPLQVEGDSSNIGLAYVAHGFARHTAVSVLAYVGLLGAGCAHMVWGGAKWLGCAPSTSVCFPGDSRVDRYIDKRTRRERRRAWMGVHAVSAAVTLLWAAGGLGVVARGGAMPGWVGDLYDGLFAKVWL